jgi:hypothetical protein
LKTKLKIPSASIKPESHWGKYEGNSFLERSSSKTFLLLYLLFLFIRKLFISFSNKQFLANSNWHCFLAVNKGYLANTAKTLAKSFLLLAIHVT